MPGPEKYNKQPKRNNSLETLYRCIKKISPPTPPDIRLLANKSTIPTPADIVFFFITKAELLDDVVLLNALSTRRTASAIEPPLDFASHSTIPMRRDVSAATGLAVFIVRRAVQLVGALLDLRVVEEDAALTLNLFHDGAAAVVVQFFGFGERGARGVRLLAAVS